MPKLPPKDKSAGLSREQRRARQAAELRANLKRRKDKGRGAGTAAASAGGAKPSDSD